MSARTGLGPLEESLLLTLDELGAGPDRPYVKAARVLAAMDRDVGVAPGYAYPVACDLASARMLWLPLVDGHGNLGGPGSPPANPRYTELRLTPVGSMAVAAERRVGPALPIGMINGNVHAGGERPPFRPAPLVGALLAVLEDDGVDDATLLATCGPPAFPTGCEVSGDVDEVLAGASGTLRVTAQVTAGEARGRPVLRITNLPPGVDSLSITSGITARTSSSAPDHLPEALASALHLPIRAVFDESSGDTARIVCELHPDVEPEVAAQRLKTEVWGVHVDIGATLPASLPVLLRTWIGDHAGDGTASALRRLVA